MCPPWSHARAGQLLERSVIEPGGKRRFGTMNDWAFAAQEHAPERWHGYPVAWNEVPYSVRRVWLDQGLVKRRRMLQRWSELPPFEDEVDS